MKNLVKGRNLSKMAVEELNKIYRTQTITLYAANGKVIKSWKSNDSPDIRDGCALFHSERKYIKISGTFVIE